MPNVHLANKDSRDGLFNRPAPTETSCPHCGSRFLHPETTPVVGGGEHRALYNRLGVEHVCRPEMRKQG